MLGLTAPVAEAAEQDGSRGRVIKIRINTAGSEEHANVHGAITLRQGNGKTKRYLWGGSTCPGQKLDAAQVATLVSAHLERGRTSVTPVFVPSEGGDKNCLVAFELSA